MTGTPQNEHLKHIEEDQSIEGIETVDDTLKNQPGRKWFNSQVLQPVIIVGGYSETDGRYFLGNWRENMVPNSQFNTTAALGSNTLTCPAGHRYRVYYAHGANYTAAAVSVLSGSIGGNAVVAFRGAPALTDNPIVVIGGTSAVDAVAGTYNNTVNEIWLNAGDTLTQTIATAAGNDMEYLWLFEDYVI